jgi:hypothetical protein
MEICKCCGQVIPEPEDKCHVSGCKKEAIWEGWYRVKDFSGNPTGLRQLRQVCNEHRSVLEGG